MKKTLIASLNILLFTLSSFAGNSDMKISYELNFDRPNSHLMVVTMTVSGVDSKTLDFAIPAWRPGRYAIQNYSRLIQEFSAVDQNKKNLPFKKSDKDTWKVETGSAKTVSVTYKFYATILDAGSTYYDEDEIYFNGANLFMYLPDSKDLPVTLKINSPEKWTIATGLKKESERNYSAPNYDDFIDCPTIISPSIKHEVVTVNNIQINIWVQGETNGDLKTLADDISKIAKVQFEFWNYVPFKEYHFLYHFFDKPFSHGVEHKNSTSICVGPLKKMSNPKDFTRIHGVTSHEMFHAWNIKTLFPDNLGLTFDYTKENYTDLLYVAEGFTSYFGDYMLIKAGLLTEEKYFNTQAKDMKVFEDTPGNSLQTLAESSQESWLTGYGYDGSKNKLVNFYSKGELVGLLLDLEIRSATNYEKSLGDVMRLLYQTRAMKKKGYTTEDLKDAIKEVSGEDFAEFFANYVYGLKPLDFKDALDKNGYSFEKLPDVGTVRFSLGLELRRQDNLWQVTNVIPGSAAFNAGIDLNDLIIASDGQFLNLISVEKSLPDSDLESWFQDLGNPKSITFTIIRKGVVRKITVSGINYDNYKYSIKKKDDNKRVW